MLIAGPYGRMRNSCFTQNRRHVATGRGADVEGSRCDTRYIGAYTLNHQSPTTDQTAPSGLHLAACIN